MNAADFSIDDPGTFRRRAFYRVSGDRYACFLDSNGYHDKWSAFDCLAARGARYRLEPETSPQDLGAPALETHCFEALKKFLDETPGWKLGFLSYDLKNEVERLHSENPDPMGFPFLSFFVPEELMILKGNSVRIICEGAPSAILQEICGFPLPDDAPYQPGDGAFPPAIRQRVPRETYLDTVASIRRHIIDGDVYELNYCMDFYAENYDCNPAQLFMRLNTAAPVPFSSFLRLDDRYILCASPERFLKKAGSRIISQPIKGTIKRSSDAAEDNDLKASLLSSEKERAENVMIVDLVRNDLARSSVPGSVQVSELFGVHSFPHWHQMISTVEAELRPEVHPADLIRNAFPMGSMTGAPKVRAMQLIDHYEAVKRGAFSGAIGYFSPEGDFDLNVVIRTMLYNARRKYLSFPVGSAITYDSVAENEYEECLLKAQAIRSLFNPPS